MDKKIILSMSGFISFLENNEKAFLYRGQSTDWPLLPKIVRFGNMTNNIRNLPDIERDMLNTFKTDSIPFIEQNIYNDLNYLSIAQHHGMATRLLDWTGNALIGLYFAVSQLPETYQTNINKPVKCSTDGFEEILHNRNVFPSEFFDELANVKSDISPETYFKILTVISNSPIKLIDTFKNAIEINESVKMQSLANLIRVLQKTPNLNEYQELSESEFELLITKNNIDYSVIWLVEIDKIRKFISNSIQDPFGIDKTYFFKSPSLDKRIIAQSGWMSIFSINSDKNGFTPFDEDENYNECLIKLIIPEPKLIEFRTGLNVCGVDAKLIFPDLDGLCQTINWRSYISFIKSNGIK